jgi:hypothetical protein
VHGLTVLFAVIWLVYASKENSVQTGYSVSNLAAN